MEKELYKAGVRINKNPPNLRIKKVSRGGIKINSTVPLTVLDNDMIKAVLSEYRIHNAEVLLRDDLSLDDLIDGIAKNRVYTKALVVINKIDLGTLEQGRSAKEKIPKSLLISAEKDMNLDVLREEIYRSLEFIHVYMKPQGKGADLEEPLILTDGSTVGDVCHKLHRDFRRRFRYAKIWGRSARFDGQRVGMGHRLIDEDVITLILEK